MGQIKCFWSLIREERLRLRLVLVENDKFFYYLTYFFFTIQLIFGIIDESYCIFSTIYRSHCTIIALSTVLLANIFFSSVLTK